MSAVGDAGTGVAVAVGAAVTVTALVGAVAEGGDSITAGPHEADIITNIKARPVNLSI